MASGERGAPDHPAADCWVCNALILDRPLVVTLIDALSEREVRTHRPCGIAWVEGDDGEIHDMRTKACADGHHRFPGRWKRDPADPFGDASYWECGKGCGHIQRHPGYGTGRAIAEREGSLFHV